MNLLPSLKRPAWFLLSVAMGWLAASHSPAQTLNQRWAKRVNDPVNKVDAGVAALIGSDGNAVVIYNSAYSASFSDIVTVKYSAAAGAVIWQRRSHATTDRSDNATGLALDHAGNAIVVGMRQGLSPNNQSFYAAKYAAADGTLLWERVFNTSAYFVAVAVDAQNNVIATGTQRKDGYSPIESDIYTFKFAGTSGATLWEHHFNGSTDSRSGDYAQALAVDAAGDVLVTGAGYRTRSGTLETQTLKIAGNNGSLVWSQLYVESGWNISAGNAIATDAAGDVMIACSTRQGNNGTRVVKYRGSDGAQVWVNSRAGKSESSGLAVDSAGNAIVTGYVYAGIVNDDATTRKISGSTGQTLWDKIYAAPLGRDDRGIAVAVDAADNAVMAGYARYSVDADPDFVILKYAAANGAALIQQRIVATEGPGGQKSLAVGPGYVVVTGSAYTATSDQDGYTTYLDDPAKPTALSLAATGVQARAARLNGSVNANGASTTVSFEYGPTTTYGKSAAAVPATVSGGAATPVSANLSGLLPGTIYHFRVTATNATGRTNGADLTFTTLSDNAKLASLATSAGTLVPGFAGVVANYLVTVPYTADHVTVTPVTEHSAATVKVNGVSVTSGSASGAISLAPGNTTISTVVTAEDRLTTMSYTIAVTRLPQEFVFNSATDVPLTANGFTTGGYPADVVLNYPPALGTVLTVVNNTGLGFIKGRFADLAHGQRVSLSYEGNTYDFVASYYGGTGNDLVLQWAERELLAWGGNGSGQLGDGTTTRRLLPTPVNAEGALAGRTILGISGGYLHSVALCSDGTLAAWGYNIQGQLGNGGGEASLVPSMVEQTGALAGQPVVAVAAGAFHNLALCEDGTVVAWGYNNHGQLGDGTKVNRREPVMVPAVGALAGKQVVAVAAGSYQSFALCDDGTVAAWGYNDEGELGDGGSTGSLVPVAVDSSGALAGRQVVSLAAGQYHALALCTDGTLVAWGYNHRGQIGDNSTAAAASPVAIGTQGALAGRTVVAITAGGDHSLARCADGALTAWGSNSHGQVGTVGISHSTTPLVVNLPGLAPGDIATMSAGRNHNLLRLADGSLLGWGDNANGQLGDGTTTSRATPAPVAGVSTAAMFAGSGAAAQHHLAVVAKPSRQRVGLLGTAAGVEGVGGDGIAELVRYAFQLDPQRAAAGQLPQARLLAGEYVLAFTQPAGINDIIYGAEWSATLRPGSWQEVPDTGSGSYHRFAIPAGEAPQGFMRLKVTPR